MVPLGVLLFKKGNGPVMFVRSANGTRMIRFVSDYQDVSVKTGPRGKKTQGVEKQQQTEMGGKNIYFGGRATRKVLEDHSRLSSVNRG